MTPPDEEWTITARQHCAIKISENALGNTKAPSTLSRRVPVLQSEKIEYSVRNYGQVWGYDNNIRDPSVGNFKSQTLKTKILLGKIPKQGSSEQDYLHMNNWKITGIPDVHNLFYC